MHGPTPSVPGARTCDPSGTTWSSCAGQVLPFVEVCANGVDDDCDGLADNGVDVDGDGWAACGGDCCDSVNCGSVKGIRINPGAFEITNNVVDDDCDPATADSVGVVACGGAPQSANVGAAELAEAMELCQTTSLASDKWGVLSAELRLADGSQPTAAQLADMMNVQAAVLDQYGAGFLPKKGPTMAGISTGRMRDLDDSDYAVSTALGSLVQPPASYVAPHGGNLPGSWGCSGVCPSGTGAYDSLSLHLSIRVPTNALSFSYRLVYASNERDRQCTPFNDFHLSLLDTVAPGIPADLNITFDGLGNPLSANNVFFDACVPSGCNTCPQGSQPLAGTGKSGITQWLTVDAPIAGGETMGLELIVFDVSDAEGDTVVLLDDFSWYGPYLGPWWP